jgi:hypothetical protein
MVQLAILGGYYEFYGVIGGSDVGTLDSVPAGRIRDVLPGARLKPRSDLSVAFCASRKTPQAIASQRQLLTFRGMKDAGYKPEFCAAKLHSQTA